jgi:hypothetical protein
MSPSSLVVETEVASPPSLIVVLGSGWSSSGTKLELMVNWYPEDVIPVELPPLLPMPVLVLELATAGEDELEEDFVVVVVVVGPMIDILPGMRLR